jgi:hypothetical protein
MDIHEFSQGAGRTKVDLVAYYLGSDLVLCIFNKNAHIGAVAVADYSHEEKRASTSVITRLGHKDDALACEAAHTISKITRRPVCVMAGVHLDRITESEIKLILKNSRGVVQKFIDEVLSERGGGARVS